MLATMYRPSIAVSSGVPAFASSVVKIAMVENPKAAPTSERVAAARGC
jgi:hypothetical protein